MSSVGCAGDSSDSPATFVVVGSGFRAGLLLDVALELDSVRCVGAVVRTPRSWTVPTFASFDEARRALNPDFVLLTTPSVATPGLIVEAVERGVPVLAETPPAGDLDGLRELWTAVGSTGLVQVAEQYLLMPSHAARLALVRSGAIGDPTQVQVSSTQQYHAVSIIRGFLGAGRGPVTARASRFTAPLVAPLSRAGWTDDDQPHPTVITIATLDFGDGRSGVYDYTDGQTRNQLRFRRLLVRGSAGELQDDEVVRMVAPRALARTPLVRRQTGHDLDANGFDTEQIGLGSEVLYRNPYVGRRWMDDEIAMATVLDQTAAWVRGTGPGPYSLADAVQDQQVALAFEESARSGAPVTTTVEAWTENAR